MLLRLLLVSTFIHHDWLRTMVRDPRRASTTISFAVADDDRSIADQTIHVALQDRQDCGDVTPII